MFCSFVLSNLEVGWFQIECRSKERLAWLREDGDSVSNSSVWGDHLESSDAPRAALVNEQPTATVWLALSSSLSDGFTSMMSSATSRPVSEMASAM